MLPFVSCMNCLSKLGMGNCPSDPVVKTLPSSAGDAGLIPDQEDKIPYASWPKNKNIKQKQYCNKFNKDFKNDLCQQNIFNIWKKNKNDVTLVLSTLMHVCSVISRVWLFVTPWIVALQAALSMGFIPTQIEIQHIT